MMPVIYEDEDKQMALVRFSTLLTKLNKKVYQPMSEYTIKNTAKELALQKVIKCREAQFTPKEGQHFLRIKDGVPEYVEQDGNSLTMYSGEQKLFTIKVSTPIEQFKGKSNIHPLNDSFCFKCQDTYACVIVDREGAITTMHNCGSHYSEGFLSDQEKEQKDRFVKEISLKIACDDANATLLQRQKDEALKSRYAHYIEILKMHIELEKNGSLFPFRDLERIPRPEKPMSLYTRTTLSVGKHFIARGVSLYDLTEIGVLEVDKVKTIDLPKLTSPKRWTLNRNESGLNWLSISTVQGWLGYDLSNGTRCPALPYQLNYEFEKLSDFEGRTIHSNDEELQIVDDNDRVAYISTD